MSQNFLSKHVDVTLKEFLKLKETLYYFKRLNGKTFEDITSAMSKDYKQVTKIAGELEVYRYSDHSLPKQRALIVERFNTIFSASDLCENDEYSFSNADIGQTEALMRISQNFVKTCIKYIKNAYMMKNVTAEGAKFEYLVVKSLLNLLKL